MYLSSASNPNESNTPDGVKRAQVGAFIDTRPCLDLGVQRFVEICDNKSLVCQLWCKGDMHVRYVIKSFVHVSFSGGAWILGGGASSLSKGVEGWGEGAKKIIERVDD